LEVRDFYNPKKKSTGRVPPSIIIEYILAEKFGWSLQEIRALSKQDIENLFLVMAEEREATRIETKENK